MMARLFIIVFISISWSASAQVDSIFILNKSIAGEFSDFTVDNLDNIYLFSPSGQMKKLNANGDSIAVFNDVRRYGKLYAIDVSNPLKVLLHFRDFGTVVVLDRFLSRRSVLDLRRLGLYQVKAIAQSYDNGYWVYDELEAKLKHLNDAGQVIDQFTDFRQLFDSVPSPQVIIDQNKLLYLYDSAFGVYIFDYYGALKKKIPLKGWKDFTVINNMLFGRNENNLFRYEPDNFRLQEFPLTGALKHSGKIIITPEKLYVLRNDRVEIYSYRRQP